MLQWLPAVLLCSPLVCALLGRSDVPRPEPTEEIQDEPIEAAYAKIHMGMTHEELHGLMAPYKQIYTGHGQWPRWTDGKTTVYVTIWFNPVTGESPGVTEKSLGRERGR
jgi:hypothetical protein